MTITKTLQRDIQKCLHRAVVHEECKEVMSDNKMTNFEYLVFQNELAQKQKEIMASSVLNETNVSAPAEARN